MKTKNIISIVSIIFCFGLFFTSCKKEEKKPTDYSPASDNSAADNAFAGIWKQIGKVANDSSTIRSFSYPMVTISPFDLVTWPKTVTIDYGPNNILCNDLVNRRGVITAHFTGRYSDSNTVITVVPSNFYHNDYKIQGTQTITNRGHVVNGHLVFRVEVVNAIITRPQGGQSSWNTTQDREWFAGENTPFNIYDDVYLIRGIASGISVNGQAYNIVTTTDLRVNVGCPWIVSGKFTLTMASYPTYPIAFDYGAGGCDASATAVLNGTTYNIIMQ